MHPAPKRNQAEFFAILPDLPRWQNIKTEQEFQDQIYLTLKLQQRIFNISGITSYMLV